MVKIVNTEGKTWHTDREKTLPLGMPALMMGFTDDGQWDPNLLADRDRRFGVDTKKIRQERHDIITHPVRAGANAWENGQPIQLQRVNGGGGHVRGTSDFRRRNRPATENFAKTSSAW